MKKDDTIGKWDATNEFRWNREHRLRRGRWLFKYKEYERYEFLEQKMVNCDGREYWRRIKRVDTFKDEGDVINI